ncbi:MAG TPA: flagellar M-ring protein FliF [Thalassospira lucentensis]|uniref:Flagellar M-ring protein n=2 Tax=Thalassospira lucentensis TaxID=168935 RepID=A0A358HQ62_9PROT|nr:flagellar basal-body MS-ring/collar protein FliF [Thalassospira lucentensis]HBU97327.1 flagellar M-ring protein FliF [Thalassospira lucentensis]HCW69872.1 flagellar M-ring protein FliF [Thalassospira lucentensis]
MSGLLQTLKTLGPTRLMAMSGVGVLLLVFFAFLILRVSAPNMELLYRDLDPADASQIVNRLEDQQVSYQLLNNGTEILVPSDQVNRMRLTMAESGLPAGGSVGYEVFDNADGFGATSFEQNINHVRALEGELARTIASIQSIQHARVHLVLPKRQMFSRETQQASASIAVKMSGGELKPEQVVAIQHLVAAAVPQLDPGKVSIIDERGRLLARGDGEQQSSTFLTQSADEMRIRNESRLRNTIEDLLSRSLGYGEVRAEVSVEMDFNKITTANERFNPDERVVRSSQTIDENSTNSETEGADPVTLQNNLPDPNLNGGAGSGTQSQETRSEETVNYEISKTTTTQVKEIGEISRVTVAVLVDGTYTTDENGERLYQERTPEDLEKIAALVRSAIGYDPQRSDQVEVINMQFVDTADLFPDEDIETFLGLDKAEIFRIAEMLVLAIVAILVILLVVRPLLTRAFETLPSAADMAQRQLLSEDMTADGTPALEGPAPVPMAPGMDDGEELINLSMVEGRVKASSVKKIGEIVEKHPEEALAIIRNWLYQES